MLTLLQADILFGTVNPSGKLPYTVAKHLGDYGEGGQIMYYPNAAIPQQDFKEGLYVDYRHFDKVSVSCCLLFVVSLADEISTTWSHGMSLATGCLIRALSCPASPSQPPHPSSLSLHHDQIYWSRLLIVVMCPPHPKRCFPRAFDD